MKQGFTIGGFRNRHGRLLRAVAVFFLLYTGADIALPQYFCGGEAAGLPDVIIASAVTDGGVAHARASDDAAVSDVSDSHSGRPGQQVPHEEDCFCCCAHVLTGLAFKAVESAELKSQPAPPGQRSVISPTLPLQYHPPRFA